MSERKYIFIFLFTIFLFLSALFWQIKDLPLYDDEPATFDQTKIFLNRKWEIHHDYNKFPGMPFILANIALIAGKTYVPSLRLINFIFGLAAIVIFFLIADTIRSGNAYLKTLQFVFLPIMFPYLFLLYTENLSTLLVLSSFYLALNKKNTLSAILSILAVSVRQINIFWLLFILVFTYLNTNGKKFDFNNIFRHLKKNWLFTLGIAFFLLLFIIFRETVLGKAPVVHPGFSYQMGNVYWTLFLLLVLFFPLHITNLFNIIIIIKKHKKLLAFLLIFILISSLTFYNNHPWNQLNEHLRNRLLLFFTSSFPLKLLFFSLIAFAILSLCFMTLNRRIYYLIYPFSFLVLSAVWLIESRYALMPIFFFILFKKDKTIALEILTLLIFISLSLYFYRGYLLQKFYL